MFEDGIRKIIKKALEEIGFDSNEVNLEHPVDLKMGDYSCNIAFKAFKDLTQNFKPKDLVYNPFFKKDINNPVTSGGLSVRDVAEKIADKINKSKNELFEKVEVAGPGFINFYLSQKILNDSIKEILEKGGGWGENKSLENQNILIEHSSPNLFKVFHIGHMVNNSIGESVSRLIGFSGANTTNISYPSDIGLGIAKAVWGVLQVKEDLFESGMNIDEKISILGEAYALGSNKYKESEDIKKEIEEINRKIYTKEDSKEFEIYKKGKDLTLESFKKFTQELGSDFDDFIFESDTADIGERIVRENIGKVFKESEGAVIFEGEKYGLHNRVFINSAGFPTYEAKDIGLLSKKFQMSNWDKSIFVTDHEQNEYVKVMLEAARQIDRNWAKKTIHIGHGRLALTTGRLSSRDGGITSAKEILEETRERVLEKMEDKDEDIANIIAIGAIKYAILKSAPGKNIVFDMDKSISFEGNSGPYLQYTYVRAKSILDKASQAGFEPSVSDVNNSEIFGNTELPKLLYRFEEVVLRAQSEYSPHYIATYIYEIASSFNSYYSHTKILDTEDKNIKEKLALTLAVALTIKNGLYLLGIEVPERM